MSTKSCAFFGHRNIDLSPYSEKLLQTVTDLIEQKGVTRFYSGFRGNFDVYCSSLVYGLKKLYPQISNTLVLSYLPENFKLPEYFDDSIYLLERQVPQRLAIAETNKLLVDKVDYIVAGVLNHGGGAYAAVRYAFKRKKPTVNIIDGWEV